MWQRAVNLYHEVKNSKDIASRQPDKKRQVILAAILYILCRQNGLPRTFSEFCQHASVTKKDIGGFYRILTPILDPQGLCARPVLAENFMKRWCNELKLPDAIFEKAVEVYKRAEDLSLTSGKCPTSVSSAVLYFVCTEPGVAPIASQQTYDSRDFATAAGVTNATLHTSLKALMLHREQLLPED
ncbi:hypothetical protein HK097_008743 [Rhizophlyctis rosea]|uniref:Transcription factor TFIIB cyclin-like domain-containing protein n=1 Tax=Rhizophlyctis rosea TaxID=64517 RepID=A0AAD5SC80_9FUNG|nr:hypothetical protein HK097_008743 [Rhizophlyctis rosea]